MLTSATLDAALELAVRAPSIHNTQPWRFGVNAEGLHLHADATRRLPATDPDERDLMISCGAVLHHLRTALAALGFLAVTDRLPDPSNRHHVATIETIPRVPTRDSLTLAVSIPRRRSDRRAYQPTQPGPDVAVELARHAAAYGTLVHPVSGAARAALVAAIAEADALQRENPCYAAELARWTGHRATADGIPHTNAPTATTIGDLAVRQFTAPSLHTPPESTPDGAGTLLILATTNDDRLSRLRAGEATSAVLLAATRLGLATCPLTQPLEIPAIRNQLRTTMLGATTTPQMIIRIGWPAPSPNPFPTTRRRPVSHVLTMGG
jgi:nitroreductase